VCTSGGHATPPAPLSKVICASARQAVFSAGETAPQFGRSDEAHTPQVLCQSRERASVQTVASTTLDVLDGWRGWRRDSHAAAAAVTWLSISLWDRRPFVRCIVGARRRFICTIARSLPTASALNEDSLMFPLRRLPAEEIEDVARGRTKGRERGRQTARKKDEKTEMVRLEEMNGSLADTGLEVT